jgi:hypothetical protein
MAMTRATTRLREEIWIAIEPLFGNRATFEKSFETRYRNGVDYEANTWAENKNMSKCVHFRPSHHQSVPKLFRDSEPGKATSN